MKHPGWFFLAAASVSFGLCYIMVPICKFFSQTLRILDEPGGHKHHDDPTPLLGGLAVLVGAWGGMAVLIYRGLLPWDLQLQGIFIGSLIVFVLGLADDFLDLTPFVKFITQVGATIVVILHGVTVTLFIGPNLLTSVVTILWIVGITNSFNLLDNMDGLASGVAAICCLIFSIIAFRQRDPVTLFLSLVMMGSLVAFLRFNFEPSEIFLGDAGSGFIGFFLGSLAVSADYLEYSQLRQLPIITPLLIFSVPLFDTFSVIAIRIMEGRSIWDADNQHFSHRLVTLGLTRKAAVLLIYLITFTVGVLAVFLSRVTFGDAILLLIHGVAIFGIIILLEYAGASQANREEFDNGST